jgi:hypothetical protein
MDHPQSKIKHALISTLIAFHMIAIVFWTMPLDSPLIAAFRSAIRPYMIGSGLFQSWDMFAPTPKSANSYIDAIVIYKNGRTSSWSFPRMEQLGFSERYVKERYRKFVENLEQDRNVALWPDAARRIARLNHKDFSNPPEFVILIRHWSDIVPRSNTSNHAEPWHTVIFYEYSVKSKDLE